MLLLLVVLRDYIHILQFPVMVVWSVYMSHEEVFEPFSLSLMLPLPITSMDSGDLEMPHLEPMVDLEKHSATPKSNEVSC